MGLRLLGWLIRDAIEALVGRPMSVTVPDISPEQEDRLRRIWREDVEGG